MRPGRRSRPGISRDGEAGQVTAMLVILTICLLLAVVAVTDTSSAYLRRQSAVSLADGAALAATDAAAAGAVYGDASDEYVVIDEAAARAAVDQYLHAIGAYADHPGLAADVRVVGPTVTVSIAMPFSLPVPVPGVPASTTIEVTGSVAMPIYQ